MRHGLGLIAGLAACGPAPRAAVDVPLVVEAVAPAAPGFVVTSATLHLDAVRFRGPSTATAWRLPTLVPTAHAHPGHDPGSDVVGEWLGPTAVDLLAGGELGPARAFTGAVTGAELDLGAGRVEVAGTLGDGARTFRLVVDAPGQVLGVPFAATLDAGDSPTWALVVDLDGMLGAVADAVPPGAAPWTPSGSDANAWAFATVQQPHYTWEVR